MSMGKNKNTASQSFDPELKNLLTSTFETGQKLSQTPYQAYEAATVAPMSPVQLEGMNMTADKARAGLGQTQLTDAMNAAKGVANFAGTDVSASTVGAPGTIGDVTGSTIDTGITFSDISPTTITDPTAVTSNTLSMNTITDPTDLSASTVSGSTVSANDVTAGNLGTTDLSPYQNQYTTSVVDAALGDLERARQMTQNKNAASAVSAGAFGGDRLGVLESETNRAFAQQAANTAANLRQAGFQNAQQMAQADLGRSMQAGLANQQANLSASTSTADQALRAGLANQQAGLTAGSQNISATLDAARANQATRQAMEAAQGAQSIQAQQATAANQLAARQANAANSLAAGRANQQAAISAGQAANQGRLAGQDAALRASLANQQAGLATNQLTAQIGQGNQDAGLRAALANQQNALAAAQQQMAGAGQLAQLAGVNRANQFQDASQLTSVGAQQQAIAQQLLDDRLRRFQEARDYPLRMFDVLRSGAGILPNPLTSSSKGRSTNLGLPGS